jgi:arsenite-transporting ATPase
MRVVLYTGKGGVGKSTVAAASAVRMAELGRRTLLVSSDLAHNLADIFGSPVGGEPVEAAENLWALEVDTLAEIRKRWRPVQDYCAGLLAYIGMEDAVAEEAALLPGLDELFLLSRVLGEIESRRYDAVIVDCPPTASSLRYFTITDTAHTKIRRISEMKRRFVRLIRPVARQVKLGRTLTPDDDIFTIFDELIDEVARLSAILADPAASSVRLVLNPDRIALNETLRSFTYFALFGLSVDAVVVNKVLPEDLADGYLGEWYALQQGLLGEIEESFFEVARLRSPLMDHEPVGLAALSGMAAGIFGEKAPDAVLSEPDQIRIATEDGRTRITFPLPNVDRDLVDLGCKGEELVVTAGSYRRVFTLPTTLVGCQVVSADFNGGALTVSFGERNTECGEQQSREEETP